MKDLAAELRGYIHPPRKGKPGESYLNATDGHFCDGWECDWPEVPEELIIRAAEALEKGCERPHDPHREGDYGR